LTARYLFYGAFVRACVTKKNYNAKENAIMMRVSCTLCFEPIHSFVVDGDHATVAFNADAGGLKRSLLAPVAVTVANIDALIRQLILVTNSSVVKEANLRVLALVAEQLHAPSEPTGGPRLLE
jgi:hypothetical protein